MVNCKANVEQQHSAREGDQFLGKKVEFPKVATLDGDGRTFDVVAGERLPRAA
jgi:hypothetical protein